jgi:hypothetical protein
MSSPTVNTVQEFPTSLATITLLARSLCNDTQAGLTGTPGEGQILTNNNAVSPFMLPFINSAIRKMYRNLRNVGDPVLIQDNVIIYGLPPVNSLANGVGGPNPTVQQVLSVNGFFDGLVQWPNFLLPSDMIYPERLWERQTGSNLQFQPMTQSKFGLPPRAQAPWLSEWEWRNNNINFVGATEQRDIRMRYYMQLPQFFSPTMDYTATYVPVLDCVDFLSYEIAVQYARMLGSPGLADLIVEAKDQLFQLKNAVTRRAQSITYQRIPYGNSDGAYENGYFTSGWTI